MSIILASGSPRRKELMHLITEDFTVHPSDAEEALPAGMPVMMAAAFLADVKAKSVAAQFPEDLVIGCDTVVVLEDQIMGKPKDRTDAVRMLKRLSGRTHQVYTAVCLKSAVDEQSFVCCTEVTFTTLSDQQIDYYIERYKPFDKAGAYGIQEWIGYVGCTQLEGSYFNVMGLPVQRLYTALQKLKI